MKTSIQTANPETGEKAAESAKPLTKAVLSDEMDKLLQQIVGEKEMGSATVAFVRAEVLGLLKRKITPTFVLKVRAKRHRQLATQIEEALEVEKKKAEEARQAAKEKKVTTNASPNEHNTIAVPAA